MIHLVFNTADIASIEEAIALDDSLAGKVVEIKDDYAVGPILDIYETEGYQVRRDWWKNILEHSPYEEQLDIVDDKLTVNQLIESLEANPEEEVWFWMGQNAHDVCGYYWLMTQLKPYQGRLQVLYLNNLPFLKKSFPTIKHLVHDRWLAMNLAENNSLGILNEKLIRYRIHSKQAIGGMTENIEKYIELNANLLEGKPNLNNSINSFKDLRYILNKIETNLQIQKEISKIETKSFDNTNYIAILKNKHKVNLEYGFAKWPLLSYLRKFKKLFIA